MTDGSEKRNRQLAFELQNSHVCEKRSKDTWQQKYGCVNAYLKRKRLDVRRSKTSLLKLLKFALVTTVPGAPEVFVQQAGVSVTVLSWQLKCKNGIIKKYTVTYFIVDDNPDKEILTTTETELPIEKLVPEKTYEFQVSRVIYSFVSDRLRTTVN